MDSLKILIVDDSPIVMRQLTMMLEQLGHRVVKAASTGKQAIAAYKEFSPDVVTMDITMPDMDGITATREIMALDAAARIIMVTSHGQEKMVLDSLKAGARGYVLKPFQINKIADALENSMKIRVLGNKLDAVIAKKEGE